MSDDDKKKPGLFDPELADQILRAALEGKTLDVPEETAEEKPAPTRPPKKLIWRRCGTRVSFQFTSRRKSGDNKSW